MGRGITSQHFCDVAIAACYLYCAAHGYFNTYAEKESTAHCELPFRSLLESRTKLPQIAAMSVE